MHKRYGDCERSRVSRKIRDLAISVVALLVLTAGLVSISPRLRERAAQIVTDPQWESARSTVQQVAGSAVLMFRGYAGENTYLFTFLVAACCFVVLMLKVIS